MIAKGEINQWKDGSQARRRVQKVFRKCRIFLLYLHVCAEQGTRIPLASPLTEMFVSFCSLQISSGCPLLHHQLLPVVLLDCQHQRMDSGFTQKPSGVK